MRGDFHSHSNYSDGYYPVDVVVDRAIKNNLNILGLTDHDSVFGVEEAFKYGQAKGLFILKGMELSTLCDKENCHLIAYFKHNVVPKSLFDFSQNIIDTRRARAKKMMESIRDTFNVNINLDELFKGIIITRGNMLRNLIDNNPLRDKKELSFMVSNDSPCFIPASKMTYKEGIKLLRSFGATIILAHPTLMTLEHVKEVLKEGVDGIEVKYPKNKEGEEELFRSLAKEYNLFVSAGSDFHGDFDKHAELGTCYLEGEELNNLLKILEIEVPYENN
ncbi:MAG: PHP domain-containing protein [Acholeplasmatales bacterium]|nr:PHP domain-containing protein [Acholeplasmatales bacterium]